MGYLHQNSFGPLPLATTPEHRVISFSQQTKKVYATKRRAPYRSRKPHHTNIVYVCTEFVRARNVCLCNSVVFSSVRWALSLSIVRRIRLEILHHKTERGKRGRDGGEGGNLPHSGKAIASYPNIGSCANCYPFRLS